MNDCFSGLCCCGCVFPVLIGALVIGLAIAAIFCPGAIQIY